MKIRFYYFGIFSLIILAVFFIGSVDYLLAASVPIKDSDSDGYADETEIKNGYSPFNPKPIKIEKSDMDSDGLNDYLEIKFETDPFNPDSDGDGYQDGEEINNLHDPLSTSTKELVSRIEINLKKQELIFFVANQAWKTFLVSTGRPGYKTPTGKFSIVNKNPKAWSKAYGLWMPYWLGLGNGSFGIHELPVWPGGYREGANHLGKPVSHGCIRLGIGAAKYIYDRVKVKTEVIIK